MEKDYVLSKYFELLEDTLDEVLTKWLNRPPTKEDYRLCERLVEKDWPETDFVLAYRNEPLGKVICSLSSDTDPNKEGIIITFEPLTLGKTL